MLTKRIGRRFTSLKGLGRSNTCGPWSAQEAFQGYGNLGIGKLTFQSLEVLNNEQALPILVRHHFQEKFGYPQPYRSSCDSQCHLEENRKASPHRPTKALIHLRSYSTKYSANGGSYP